MLVLNTKGSVDLFRKYSHTAATHTQNPTQELLRKIHQKTRKLRKVSFRFKKHWRRSQPALETSGSARSKLYCRTTSESTRTGRRLYRLVLTTLLTEIQGVLFAGTFDFLGRVVLILTTQNYCLFNTQLSQPIALVRVLALCSSLLGEPSAVSTPSVA